MDGGRRRIMVDIMIDMTNRNKRYRGGVGLCHYCRHDLFPHGKIFDASTDKVAKQMPNGSWKCGVCVREDFEKATRLMNRRYD
jgi:hypothetical protein